ncbi:PREDICTED: potassium channel subfamily K member 13-like [Acromyrmex echinatior]|uniref:Potassium channel subfamily K member 13 n=1 Tax=Acromyrmex echinatior TaxID=103372 RepID=F4W5D1_ACREC|nr:PREDICTED: potassium channel subfamily K member 13-like [Acromyrmex echinatior]EGI70581.1 Potassium channel subfamily K member 13 [Acromyrmex echinatior]
MCLCGGLAEDNARIILLAVVLAAYMLAGAALFQRLESDFEIRQATEFWRVYHAFRKHHLRGSPLALQRLHELLYAYGNASATGIINKRRRWDFPGSFHFVGTIVSTIGYGSTAPQTTTGKAAVVLYGFFGCSGGILFFNLFLERIITLLAWILRSWHVRRLRRRLRKTTLTSRRIPKSSSTQRTSLPDILDDDDDHVNLDQWKPSVYWVMFYLSVTSCIVACCAAALYAPLEGWNYFDALYFAFVSFTTIGFGDFVSTQQPNYPYVHWYRFTNFVFLVVGCCCIYSLLNVTSIVIKQGLNYVIHKLQYGNRNVAAPYLPRRQSSVSTVYYSKRRPNRLVGRDSIRAQDNSETPRRMSGELVSMKEFLSANKVPLAVMQKQLYDAAQKQKGGGSLAATPNHQVLKPGAVGPLAIASEKFESKSTINR